MMTATDVKPKLQPAGRPELTQLGSWLGAQVVFGLLPLWGSYLLVKLFGATTQWSDYVQNGEFALYSAAIATTGLFLVFRELPAPFPYRAGLGLVLAVTLVISTLLFAGVFVATRLPTQPGALPSLNVPWLSNVSIPLYVAALGATVVATLIDMLRGSYDAGALSKQQMNKFRDDFRAITEDNDGS